MSKINLNASKLLGFRLMTAESGAKVGQKAGIKVGTKVGVKVGGKLP